MSFFDQLRQLGISLEKECVTLKKQAEKRSTEDSEDDTGNAEAILMLRNLQTETKAMKKHISDALLTLQSDNFLQVSTACHELMAWQTEKLEEVENYLGQYGFKPMPHRDQSKQDVVDPSRGELQDSSETPSDVPPEHEHHTPARSDTQPFDHSRTPTLEDFGLSEEMLTKKYSYDIDYSALGNLNPTAESTARCHYDKTASITSSSTSNDAHTNSKSSYSGNIDSETPGFDNIPEEFKHDGLLVTPGLMDGRELSLTTPIMKGLNRAHRNMLAEDSASPMPSRCSDTRVKLGQPTLRNPRQKTNNDTATRKLPPKGDSRLKKTNSQLVSSLKMDHSDLSSDSPEMPVLLAAGLPELLSTSNSRHKQDCNDYNLDDNSPALPVLITPGIKQLEKVLQTPQREQLKDFTTDSPIAPVLQTPGLKQLQSPDRVQLKNVTPDSPIPPVIQTPGLKQLRTVDVPLPKQPTLTQEDPMDMPLPDTPELTCNFKNLYLGNSAMVASPLAVSSTAEKFSRNIPGGINDVTTERDRVKSQLFPRATVPTLSYPQLDTNEILDFPPSPELTSTFCFTAPFVPEWKENIPPVLPQPEHTPRLEPECPERLALVTDEEYSHHPDYLRRLLPLATLNKAVTVANKVLNDRIRNGEGSYITMSDLRTEMGLNLKSFFLTMTLLHRLTENKVRGGEITYVVPFD